MLVATASCSLLPNLTADLEEKSVSELVESVYQNGFFRLVRLVTEILQQLIEIHAARGAKLHVSRRVAEIVSATSAITLALNSTAASSFELACLDSRKRARNFDCSCSDHFLELIFELDAMLL